jgi:hypothetical protein
LNSQAENEAQTALKNAKEQYDLVQDRSDHELFNDMQKAYTNAHSALSNKSWKLASNNAATVISYAVQILSIARPSDPNIFQFKIKDSMKNMPISYGEVMYGPAKEAGASGQITEAEKNRLTRAAFELEREAKIETIKNGILKLDRSDVSSGAPMFFIISRKGGGGYVSFVNVKSQTVEVSFNIRGEVQRIPFSIEYKTRDTLNEDVVKIVFSYKRDSDNGYTDYQTQVELTNDKGFLVLDPQALNISLAEKISYRIEVRGTVKSGNIRSFTYNGRTLPLWDIEKEALIVLR